MVIAEVIQKDLDIEYCACKGCQQELNANAKLIRRIMNLTEFLQGRETPSDNPVDLRGVRTLRDLLLVVKKELRPLNEMLAGLEPLEEVP